MNTISTESVRVRPVESMDLELRASWLNHTRVNQYLGYSLPIDRRDNLNWFARVSQDSRRRELVLMTSRDDAPIGFAGFLHIDTTVRRAEHHIFLGPEHHGKGLGEPAYHAITEYGFGQLALNRIYGYQHVGNEAAQRLTDRMGWTREGRLVADGLYHGLVVDRFLIRLLREEWLAWKAARGLP